MMEYRDQKSKADDKEALISKKQSKNFLPNNKFTNTDKSKQESHNIIKESAGSKKRASKLKDQFLIENLKSRKRALLSKRIELVDSSKAHCKNIQYLDQPQKELTDGSGNENYANNCNCQWKIKAPEDKRIEIQINNMNTQAEADILWIFDGLNADPKHLLAKLSGDKSAIVITSNSNEVLLWFISDTYITGKGWKLDYNWVD